MEEIKYCEDAYKLYGIKTVCGKGCPLFGYCPRLILEDDTDKAIERAMGAMIKIIRGL